MDAAGTYRCCPPNRIGGQHHRPIISGIAGKPANASDKADADRARRQLQDRMIAGWWLVRDICLCISNIKNPKQLNDYDPSIFGSAAIDLVEFIALSFNLLLVPLDLLILVGRLPFAPL